MGGCEFAALQKCGLGRTPKGKDLFHLAGTSPCDSFHARTVTPAIADWDLNLCPTSISHLHHACHCAFNNILKPILVQGEVPSTNTAILPRSRSQDDAYVADRRNGIRTHQTLSQRFEPQ
jgi:hypothetical protein